MRERITGSDSLRWSADPSEATIEQLSIVTSISNAPSGPHGCHGLFVVGDHGLWSPTQKARSICSAWLLAISMTVATSSSSPTSKKAKEITPELAEPDHPHFHHARVHQERILIGLVGGDRVIGVPIGVSDRAAPLQPWVCRGSGHRSVALFQWDDGDAEKLPFPGLLVRQVFDDPLHRRTDVLGRLVLRRGFLIVQEHDGGQQGVAHEGA
jgi:hypothetical protein